MFAGFLAMCFVVALITVFAMAFWAIVAFIAKRIIK